METWRSDRRSDGWKCSDSGWIILVDHLCHGRKDSMDRDDVDKITSIKVRKRKMTESNLPKGSSQI